MGAWFLVEALHNIKHPMLGLPSIQLAYVFATAKVSGDGSRTLSSTGMPNMPRSMYSYHIKEYDDINPCQEETHA